MDSGERRNDVRECGLAASPCPNEFERLAVLERAIKTDSRGYREVGGALGEINAQRLYRIVGFQTFEIYVAQRWQMSRGYAYRKMSAARVVEILGEAGAARLPENEAQARELAVLSEDPDVLRNVWEAIVRGSAGKRITASSIRCAVERLT